LLGGQGLALVPDQRHQQAVFGRGQRDRPAVHAHLAGVQPQQQAAVVVDLGLGLPGSRPAEQRLHARGQLPVTERLGQVVVGAGVQPAHLVRFPSVRGQHQHRDVAHVADALEDGPAVQRGQPDVQDDQVRPGRVEAPQPFLPILRGDNVKTMTREHGADAERDVLLVLDDQDPALHDRAGR
jgi:hypothetical protein